MNRVTFFKAFTLAIFLGVANFGWQFFQAAPNFVEATERTYFQACALLLAWAFWREPGEKTERRGRGPGFCD